MVANQLLLPSNKLQCLSSLSHKDYWEKDAFYKVKAPFSPSVIPCIVFVVTGLCSCAAFHGIFLGTFQRLITFTNGSNWKVPCPSQCLIPEGEASSDSAPMDTTSCGVRGGQSISSSAGGDLSRSINSYLCAGPKCFYCRKKGVT